MDVFEDVDKVPKLKASAQPWATMNAEITDPGPLPTPTSVQSAQSYHRFSFLEPEVGQNIALYAPPFASNSAIQVFAFPFI